MHVHLLHFSALCTSEIKKQLRKALSVCKDVEHFYEFFEVNFKEKSQILKKELYLSENEPQFVKYD